MEPCQSCNGDPQWRRIGCPRCDTGPVSNERMPVAIANLIARLKGGKS